MDDEEENAESKCYIHTYIQTYRQSDPLPKWVVEELSGRNELNEQIYFGAYLADEY